MIRHRSHPLLRAGFTLVEVVIAIVVLTVGLLGLASTAALVTRMIARGHRAAAAATLAARHLERLRAEACRDRAPGSAQLARGGAVVARTSWRYVTAAESTHRVHLVVTYLTQPGRWRSDSLETVISCLR